jgi:peroxiredoxin
MLKTMKYRKMATAWQAEYEPQAPKAGDIAPDFELSDVNGENTVRLSDFRGDKPAALIFGSFT